MIEQCYNVKQAKITHGEVWDKHFAAVGISIAEEATITTITSAIC